MALNHDQSASWSDVAYTGNQIERSGNTDPISWADIEKALDPSLGRKSEYSAVSQPDHLLCDPAQTSDEAEISSPIFNENLQEPNATESPRSPKLNTSLLRVLGNLTQKKNTADAAHPEREQLPAAVEPTIEAKSDIGLALKPGQEVHKPGQVARAIVRLQAAITSPIGLLDLNPPTRSEFPHADSIGLTSDTSYQPSDDLLAPSPSSGSRPRSAIERLAAQRRALPATVELPQPEPVTKVESKPSVSRKRISARPTERTTTDPRPLDDPFQYVSGQQQIFNEKYDVDNCKYGRTTHLPDGSVVKMHTASDNSTLKRTTGENGANSTCVHDPYGRLVIEQKTNELGEWEFSQLSYNDSKGVRPFPSQKLTIYSDGSMTKFKFSPMGHVESQDRYA